MAGTPRPLTPDRAYHLMLLVAVEPTLLRPACRVDDVDREIALRRAGEPMCIGCGWTADRPILTVMADRAARWLDVCSDCSHAMLAAAAERALGRSGWGRP